LGAENTFQPQRLDRSELAVLAVICRESAAIAGAANQIGARTCRGTHKKRCRAFNAAQPRTWFKAGPPAFTSPDRAVSGRAPTWLMISAADAAERTAGAERQAAGQAVEKPRGIKVAIAAALRGVNRSGLGPSVQGSYLNGHRDALDQEDRTNG